MAGGRSRARRCRSRSATSSRRSSWSTQYGVDQVRYFLLRELPFGSDGDFSRRAMVNRINGDLANDFGNLAQRVLSMIQRNCDGHGAGAGRASRRRRGVARRGARAPRQRCASNSPSRPSTARSSCIWQVVADANRYVDEQAPWALAQDRSGTHGRRCSMCWPRRSGISPILAQPVVPEAAARLLDQLGQPADRRDFAALAAHPLAPGHGAARNPKAYFRAFVEVIATAA